MTSELRYLLKTNSDCEGSSDQDSLRCVLTDLRAVADDLDLGFGRALLEARLFQAARDWLAFDPSI